MLKLKGIKPMGCQVLVTKNLYGWDDFNESGIIINKRGDLKHYQTVLAIGDDVKWVKPGDVVAINFFKYAEFKDDPGSIKVNGTNKIVELHLNEIELVGEDDEDVACFFIDQRDIKYVITDYKEVTYEQNKHKLIQVKQPKVQLVLPSNKIKVS